MKPVTTHEKYRIINNMLLKLEKILGQQFIKPVISMYRKNKTITNAVN